MFSPASDPVFNDLISVFLLLLFVLWILISVDFKSVGIDFNSHRKTWLYLLLIGIFIALLIVIYYLIRIIRELKAQNQI